VLLVTRLFSLLLLVAMPHLVSASIGTYWSYQQLLDKADLVVIGKPVSTIETKQRTDFNRLILGPRAKLGFFDRESDDDTIPLIGLETKFDVKAILKGNRKLHQFVVHHYRLAKPEIPIVGDTPALLTFDVGASYLLFLVKEPDGRYGPASDQQDPARTCAFKLSADVE
jgi:hypothetical protein